MDTHEIVPRPRCVEGHTIQWVRDHAGLFDQGQAADVIRWLCDMADERSALRTQILAIHHSAGDALEARGTEVPSGAEGRDIAFHMLEATAGHLSWTKHIIEDMLGDIPDWPPPPAWAESDVPLTHRLHREALQRLGYT